MAKPELLKPILEARFELEFCEEDCKAGAEARLDRLVSEALAGTPLSRMQLIEALSGRYRDYKRGRLRQERLRGSI